MEPNYNKIVFVDTETVSISPPYIISIAYIAYENGKRIGAGYKVCNPEYKINPRASEVNGFYNEDLVDKPLFSEIWGDIRYYFENSIWIAHNAKFDQKAITKTCERYNIIVPKHWTCCTYDNARLFLSKNEVPNHKLNTLCDYFDIKLLNHHNAGDDTYACMKLYNKLVQLSDGNLEIKDEVL